LRTLDPAESARKQGEPDYNVSIVYYMRRAQEIAGTEGELQVGYRRRRKTTKTRKNRTGGDRADLNHRDASVRPDKETKGGFMNFTRKLFLSDNNLVYLMNGRALLTCPICNHDKFQLRLGTLGKSKLSTVTNDILFGHTSHDMLDISIKSYFCDECGYGIIVRDQKFNTTSYRNTLTSIPVE
jgi:hypothetical protein